MKFKLILLFALFAISSIGCGKYCNKIFFLFVMDKYGYNIENETVIFEFDSGKYRYVTHDITGVRSKIGELTINEVCLAGEFNSWSKDLCPMEKVSNKRYKLKRPKKDFDNNTMIQFKFVINGEYWVEPPFRAANRVIVNRRHRNHNLWLLIVDR